MKAETLLKEVHGVLVIDLLKHAYPLDTKYGHCFIEPEPGIYYVNQIDPIILPGQKAFTRESIKENRPLTVIQDIMEELVDGDGKVLIPEYVMQRKAKFLLQAPNIPARAVKIAKIIAEEYLESMLPYSCAQDFQDMLSEHLNQDGVEAHRTGHLEAACLRLISEISMFVGADVWNFYFLELRNTDLIITKSCDYRVYDWTLIQEERREIARQKAEELLNI